MNFFAFLNTLMILSEVQDSDPWKGTMISAGSFWKYSSLDLSPCKFENISCIASDLLQPGFPHIKIGILLIIHGIIAKIFSLIALLSAIPSGSCIRAK